MPAGAIAHPIHRKSGAGAVLAALALASVGELAGVLGLRPRGGCLGLRLDHPAALRAAISERRPELA